MLCSCTGSDDVVSSEPPSDYNLKTVPDTRVPFALDRNVPTMPGTSVPTTTTTDMPTTFDTSLPAKSGTCVTVTANANVLSRIADDVQNSEGLKGLESLEVNYWMVE